MSADLDLISAAMTTIRADTGASSGLYASNSTGNAFLIGGAHDAESDSLQADRAWPYIVIDVSGNTETDTTNVGECDLILRFIIVGNRTMETIDGAVPARTIAIEERLRALFQRQSVSSSSRWTFSSPNLLRSNRLPPNGNETRKLIEYRVGASRVSGA